MKKKIPVLLTKFTLVITLFMLLNFILSCSEEIGFGDPIENFKLTTDQIYLTIDAGSSADIQVTGTLTTSGSYFTVEIGYTNLTGVSLSGCDHVTFDSTNSGTCTLTINVPASAIPGDYDMDLHGRAYWSNTNTLDGTSISINVPNPEPDFSIAFEPKNITMERGKTDTVSINITRLNGNTESINFVPSFSPGINVDIFPWDQVTGNSTSVIISVDQSLPPGNYKVEATGVGNTTGRGRTDTLNVTVDTLNSLWFIVTPDPAPPILYDIDGDYAVGEGGTILKTTDEGVTWQYLSSGTSETLRSVVIGSSAVYAAGDNGIILKSTDDGNSWQDISIESNYNLYDIKEPSQVWVVGDEGQRGVALRSTDEGLTWEVMTPNFNARLFLSVSFSDVSHGIIVGNFFQSLLRTTNAGQDWDIISVPVTQLNHAVGVSVACGSAGIYRSTDAGQSWFQDFGGHHLNSFWGNIFVGYGTIIHYQGGTYNIEETGIPGFGAPLWGVTRNGTFIAVGGSSSLGKGVIIKRQPL